MYYIPKRLIAVDEIYGESPLAEYNQTYFMEMYIKNIEGFGGDGDFLSKFNLQIRDQITFTIARRIFSQETTNEDQVRPYEGDLIYFPLNRKLFEIQFVEHESIFYQLGALQTFDLKCELFEYSNQILNTGIAEVDNIQRNFSLSMTVDSIQTESGLHLLDEQGFVIVREEYSVDTSAGDAFADNQEIQTESDDFVDFTEMDPFSEGRI